MHMPRCYAFQDSKAAQDVLGQLSFTCIGLLWTSLYNSRRWTSLRLQAKWTCSKLAGLATEIGKNIIGLQAFEQSKEPPDRPHFP